MRIGTFAHVERVKGSGLAQGACLGKLFTNLQHYS